MRTPNFDRLAKKGVVFDSAYAQIAGEAAKSFFIDNPFDQFILFYRSVQSIPLQHADRTAT